MKNTVERWDVADLLKFNLINKSHQIIRNQIIGLLLLILLAARLKIIDLQFFVKYQIIMFRNKIIEIFVVFNFKTPVIYIEVVYFYIISHYINVGTQYFFYQFTE